MGAAAGAAELSSRTAALSPHPSPDLTGPEVFVRTSYFVSGLPPGI